jgi:hypothetical protein
MRRTDILRDHPEAGRIVPEYRKARMREIIYRPYRLSPRYRATIGRNRARAARSTGCSVGLNSTHHSTRHFSRYNPRRVSPPGSIFDVEHFPRVPRRPCLLVKTFGVGSHEGGAIHDSPARSRCDHAPRTSSKIN